MHDGAFRHLLVPTDGSDASVAAARLAIRIARSTGARLDALFVIDDMLCDELRRFDARDPALIEHELRAHGERYLDLVRDEAEHAGIAADAAIRRGDPFEEIVAHAGASGADLIVMGHTGRRPRARVLLGSVAERVIEFAPCPVLIVKRDAASAL